MTDVWITRTEPGASETAGRVRELGLQPIIAPLLRTAAVQADLPTAGEAIAFTSPNGPRHYVGRTDIPAWCVGEATAEAARVAGFSYIRIGGHDVADLAARLTYELDRPLVHWAGAHVAGDLVGALAGAGHAVRRAVAYRAEAVSRSPLREPADIVLLHSPRAANLFAELAPGLAPTAVCLSPRVAKAVEPVPGLKRFTAEVPTEAALMETLTRAANE